MDASVRRAALGMCAATIPRSSRGPRRIGFLGVDVFRLAPNGSSTGVLKVRGGIVEEIGIGDESLTKDHRAQTTFLNSFC